MKTASSILLIISVLLSDIMCAVVAWEYCDLVWGGKYAGYSAPPYIAFFTAIPFVAAIIICVLIAVILRKKANA